MRWFLIGFVACLMQASLAHAAASVPPSFADLVERLSPAVVNVSTTQKVKTGGVKLQFKGLPQGQDLEQFRDFFEQFGERFGAPGGGEGGGTERSVTSLGSGFVIDPAGYVVTNHHVVAEADDITVTFHDDSKYSAKVVGRDPKTDLALLKIESKKPLPAVKFGNSDRMRVGDWVIAIGNPFGLGGSVSAGIISARSRNINAGPFDDFIQTDAAINRGNSGGPLFNEVGEVIGVNSAIFSPSGGNIGIGFAIPSALADPVLKQLREFGRTHRGWLGVKIQHVTDEIADSVGLPRPRGALVLEVNEGSPAAKAGVKPGDVIVQFDGRNINEMRQLPRQVAETKIGKEVTVVVWRDGKERKLNITLGELDESAEEAKSPAKVEKPKRTSNSEHWMGLELLPIDDAARREFRLGKEAAGLLVMSAKPADAGAEMATQPNDILIEANQRVLATVEDLKQAMAAAKRQGKKNVLVRINRGGNIMFVTMKVS